MPSNDPVSLWTALQSTGELSYSFISAPNVTVSLRELTECTFLAGRAGELHGRSVLIATTEQVCTALAALELDGTARRIVLYPSDTPLEHLPFVVASAGVDAIVSDRALPEPKCCGVDRFVCGTTTQPSHTDRTASHATEWILLTSGTTGQPKLVLHTLASLCAGIRSTDKPESLVIWSTFYDIRRYGGLQIFLRAILAGTSLVLSGGTEPLAGFLTRAGAQGVTHISGTPSHWRRALMTAAVHKIAPRYVRLSGEIVDQAILHSLRSCYPEARVAHAFASTEAGLAFDVNDGLPGFPASLVTESGRNVDLRVSNGSLRVRSAAAAARYIGQQQDAIKDEDGFVDTGDLVELRGDRYHFVGRRDGVINVGGRKVRPEEVEGVINRHPGVRMSLVRPRKNPLTGAVVVADVVLAGASSGGRQNELEQEIRKLCRAALPPHSVPAIINFVNELAVAATGKIARRYA